MKTLGGYAELALGGYPCVSYMRHMLPQGLCWRSPDDVEDSRPGPTAARHKLLKPETTGDANDKWKAYGRKTLIEQMCLVVCEDVCILV